MVSSLLVNERYVEDGSMVGSLAQLREVVDIILRYGLVRGLHLSMVNCRTPVLGLGLGVDFVFAKNRQSLCNQMAEPPQPMAEPPQP